MQRHLLLSLGIQGPVHLHTPVHRSVILTSWLRALNSSIMNRHVFITVAPRAFLRRLAFCENRKINNNNINSFSNYKYD